MRWTSEQEAFLKSNYPVKGISWCMDKLNLTRPQIRMKACRLGLRQDRESDFFKDWQARAAQSKVGKKRPEQSLVMKKNHSEGKLIKTESQRKAISIRQSKWIAENGHPRGALGMKHSEETKRVISEKSKSFWENMSDEERDKFSARAAINGQKVAAMNRNGCTWKAAWREIGGVKKYYRSKWEANYAYYLQWLKDKGEIAEWKHEPDTFWFDGVKRGCVSYLPDFYVKENDGAVAYHEVKGWMDDRSKTKIKRMAKYHPNVKLIVIDAKSYHSIRKKVQDIVPGWEQ